MEEDKRTSDESSVPLSIVITEVLIIRELTYYPFGSKGGHINKMSLKSHSIIQF